MIQHIQHEVFPGEPRQEELQKKHIIVRYKIRIFKIKNLADLCIWNVSDCSLELTMPQLPHSAGQYDSLVEILDLVLNHTSFAI